MLIQSKAVTASSVLKQLNRILWIKLKIDLYMHVHTLPLLLLLKFSLGAYLALRDGKYMSDRFLENLQ